MDLLRDTIAVPRIRGAQLREAAYALRQLAADRIELDPKRLHESSSASRRCTTRRAKFAHVRRRCPGSGFTPDALKDLEMTAYLETLALQEQAARSRYDGLATRLSAERNKAATKLGREVNAQ